MEVHEIFILLKVSRVKIKVHTIFLINSIFHLTLPSDVNFRLKVANFGGGFGTTYILLYVKTLSVYKLVRFTHKKGPSF